jgi:hypothetical protein
MLTVPVFLHVEVDFQRQVMSTQPISYTLVVVMSGMHQTEDLERPEMCNLFATRPEDNTAS